MHMPRTLEVTVTEDLHTVRNIQRHCTLQLYIVQLLVSILVKLLKPNVQVNSVDDIYCSSLPHPGTSLLDADLAVFVSVHGLQIIPRLLPQQASN